MRSSRSHTAARLVCDHGGGAGGGRPRRERRVPSVFEKSVPFSLKPRTCEVTALRQWVHCVQSHGIMGSAWLTYLRVCRWERRRGGITPTTTVLCAAAGVGMAAAAASVSHVKWKEWLSCESAVAAAATTRRVPQEGNRPQDTVSPCFECAHGSVRDDAAQPQCPALGRLLS